MTQLPNQAIKAILFDLDGTLIDTDDMAQAKLATHLRILGEDRAHRLARWLLMQAEGPGNAFITLLDWLGLEVPLMSLADWLRRRRGLKPAHEWQLIAGVEEMLETLNGRYPLALVTTRTRFHINTFLTQFPHIADHLSVTVGIQDTRRLKPHPAPILLAADKLGIPIQNCLMVGDTTVDIKAARRAGAWSTAVLCGFGQRPELQQAGAHLILESTAQLAGWLLDV